MFTRKQVNEQLEKWAEVAYQRDVPEYAKEMIEALETCQRLGAWLKVLTTDCGDCPEALNDVCLACTETAERFKEWWA